ncbi:hypothetical protein AVEN_223726-1 [Araneus ventricosus]|uniref:Uncharacterized protein n=1 Tax=Araneus ventricosus TaxID=182803 RepID=A0A4Y2UM99_ARAVE|nr:hypothetical protein AVEN_223726-1 [Araneus ventricosus]
MGSQKTRLRFLMNLHISGLQNKPSITQTVKVPRKNLQLHLSCIASFHHRYFAPIMSIKEKLIDSLQELKNLVYTDPTLARASNNKAEKALFLIFHAGRRNINFTEGEKEQLGNLITEVIKPIQINIVSTSFRDRSRLDTSVLQKRSALQFLVEKYAQFPAKDSTLFNQLEQVNIKESIKILDDLIKYWRDISDSDEGESDRESAGASDMPNTHTWWSN